MSGPDMRHWFQRGSMVAACGARVELVHPLLAAMLWFKTPFMPKCERCVAVCAMAYMVAGGR